MNARLGEWKDKSIGRFWAIKFLRNEIPALGFQPRMRGRLRTNKRFSAKKGQNVRWERIGRISGSSNKCDIPCSLPFTYPRTPSPFPKGRDGRVESGRVGPRPVRNLLFSPCCRRKTNNAACRSNRAPTNRPNLSTPFYRVIVSFFFFFFLFSFRA